MTQVQITAIDNQIGSSLKGQRRVLWTGKKNAAMKWLIKLEAKYRTLFISYLIEEIK